MYFSDWSKEVKELEEWQKSSQMFFLSPTNAKDIQ